MSKEQDKVIKRVMLSTSEELGSVRCMKDIYNVAFQENGETDIRFLVEIEKHYQSKGLSFPRLWNECLQQFGEPKIKNILNVSTVKTPIFSRGIINEKCSILREA